MFNKMQQTYLSVLIITILILLFGVEKDANCKLKESPPLEEEEINKIVEIGDDVIPRLIDWFGSADVRRKLDILGILRRMNGTNSKEAMLGILEPLCTKPLSDEKYQHIPKEEFLKRFILINLGGSGETGLAAVKERLQGAEGEFRKCLIIGSGFLGDSTYYESIVEILETDNNPYSRELSAYALGRIGNKKAIPKLEKALKDEFYYDASGASPGVDDIIPPGEPGSINYPVREAAIHALSDMGVKVNRRWHDMWIGDKIPPGIANKPYTPPPGLTNKPTPPGQEKKQ